MSLFCLVSISISRTYFCPPKKPSFSPSNLPFLCLFPFRSTKREEGKKALRQEKSLSVPSNRKIHRRFDEKAEILSGKEKNLSNLYPSSLQPCLEPVIPEKGKGKGKEEEEEEEEGNKS